MPGPDLSASGRVEALVALSPCRVGCRCRCRCRSMQSLLFEVLADNFSGFSCPNGAGNFLPARIIDHPEIQVVQGAMVVAGDRDRHAISVPIETTLAAKVRFDHAA